MTSLWPKRKSLWKKRSIKVPKPVTKPSWGRLWPYLRPYSPWVLLACLAGAFRFGIPLAVPWAVKILVDEVLTEAGPGQYAGLYRILGALAAAYVVWILASYVRLYFTGMAGSRMVFGLRHALFSRVQEMTPDFFAKRKTGAVVSRLMNDMLAVQQLLTNGVTSAFMDLVSVFLVAGLMAGMHWKLALAAFAAVPLYLVAGRIFMEQVRFSSRQVQDHTEKLSGALHEKISALPVVQSFTNEAFEEKSFLGLCREQLGAVLRNVRLQSLSLSIMGFLAAMTPLVVIGYGACLVIQKELTAGELVAFYAYAGFLYMPLNRLMELNVAVGSAAASMDRIFEVMDTEPAVKDSPFAVQLKETRGLISFEDVSFAYGNGHPVFEHFSLEISPRECAAFCGPSGAGKSTLIKLLLRFYEPQAGIIRLDGTDIRSFTLASLREKIAWVPQEPVLFSGTILENILYGRPGAAAGEAVEAARAANAHDFIMRLPAQYETQAGEKGLALSAGEKQRIAIARAFLKKAPILALDEPSSALDEASERLISASLQGLKQGKTSLIISHRLSMMEHAGRVLELRSGKVSELSRSGLFHAAEKITPGL